jgi:hypothetical protein
VGKFWCRLFYFCALANFGAKLALHHKPSQVAIFGSGRDSEPKIGATLPKIHRQFIATG